jgi:isochorismate hydrolase
MPKEFDRLQLKNALLLIVDVQGKLARIVDQSEAVIKQIGIMIQACRILEVPIVWAEQLPEKLGTTVPAFGCCDDEVIDGLIRESRRSQIILCGIEAHVCVWQTAASLISQGYSVHLICDAISSRSPANREIAIQRIAAVGGLLSNVEMALFELMKDAKHPKFRDVSKLLR